MKSQTICANCVMDTVADPNIQFDDNGVCNHCLRYEEKKNARVTTCESDFKKLIENIKKRSKHDKYDAIVGVSGGVDSSYVLQLAVEQGLRVLAVHVDNNWNSELAVSNIEQLVKKLNVPLKTVVLNWKEFRQIQTAFLKAESPDGEIPTDHAIYANIWRIAAQYNVKHILSGMNFQTESISVDNWSYGHMDGKYILSVSQRNGHKIDQKKFEILTIPKLVYYSAVKGIKTISLLNYVKYNKDEVKQKLIDDIGWRPYAGKHFESEYTKFYQGYYIVARFNIDKRKGHLSDLINSGQMTRDEALQVLATKPLSDEELKNLKGYVSDKLEIDRGLIEQLAPIPVRRDAYSSNKAIFKKIKSTLDALRRINVYPK